MISRRLEDEAKLKMAAALLTVKKQLQANVRGCFDGEIGLSAERALHWGPYAHALVTAMRACAGNQIPDVHVKHSYEVWHCFQVL